MEFVPPARKACFPRFEGAAARTAVGWALLSYGLAKDFDIFPVPEIVLAPGGKPLFKRCDLYFSISHGKTYALCAISRYPVGVDVETRRRINPRIRERVLAPGEKDEDFFDMWVLKESYIKLRGEKDVPFNKINFARSANTPVFEGNGVFGVLYDEIPGCSAAVCAYNKPETAGIEFVPRENLCCAENSS